MKKIFLICFLFVSALIIANLPEKMFDFHKSVFPCLQYKDDINKSIILKRLYTRHWKHSYMRAETGNACITRGVKNIVLP